MNTDKAYAEKIAGEYAPKEERKVVALKKLDSRARLPASIFAYTSGIIMTLLLGVGMCLSMKVIGDGSRLCTVLGVGMCLSMKVIGDGSTALMTLGIIVGVIGIAGVSINYPLYKKILGNSKKKYSADILALADQIAAE